jgi:hypothetical protein
VDIESRTLVVKFSPNRKPVLLDSDDKTAFIQGERHVIPSVVKAGMTVSFTYKRCHSIILASNA